MTDLSRLFCTFKILIKNQVSFDFQKIRSYSYWNTASGTRSLIHINSFPKGWPSSSNTWELASSLNCPDVLKRYQTEQKNALVSPTKSSPKAAKSQSGKKAKTSKTSSKTTKSPAKKSKPSSKSTNSKPATKAAKKQVIDDADQDWEVEKIIDVEYNEDGTKKFLIRWKGCDLSQDTWEPEDNVNSPDLIEAFMSKADASDEVPKKKSRKA